MSRSHFTYVTAHSLTFPSLYLRHSSFSNPSVASPTSQLILQPFRCFPYVTAHSPTLPLLHLRHSSFTNPSVASLTSQLSPTLLLLLLRHRLFTYVTWRTAHDALYICDQPMKVKILFNHKCRPRGKKQNPREPYAISSLEVCSVVDDRWRKVRSRLVL